MKSYYLSIIMMLWGSLAIAKSITVEDLHFECGGSAKIVSVSDSYYSPYQPPKGRVEAVPASAGYKAKISLSNLDESCQILIDKYKILVAEKDFDASVTLKVDDLETQSVEHVGYIANNSIGQRFEFKTSQHLSYVLNKKYLPLLNFSPKIHEEKITLAASKTFSQRVSGSSLFANMSAKLPYFSNHVYGSQQAHHLFPKQKLKVAAKIADLVPYLMRHNEFSVSNSFFKLFFKLEPSDSILKSEYAKEIWNIFEAASKSSNSTYNTMFFNFTSGGVGSYMGAFFAKKLVEIIQLGDFSKTKLTLLAYKFPTLLNLNFLFPTPEKCFPIDDEQISQVLDFWLEEADVLAYPYNRKQPLLSAVKGLLSEHGCYYNDLSFDNIAKAKELYRTLSL